MTATRSSAPQAPLDLHEDSCRTAGSDAWIAAARERREAILAAGCTRWPKTLRLVSTSGLNVPGRCGSTNQCDYCSILGGVVWSEMLALDAMEGDAPTLYVCLTTPRATLDRTQFTTARKRLLEALRAEWPGCEYVCLVEFTTGYGERSGGRRRPHWNLLVKGVPADAYAIATMRAIIEREWCSRTGAKMRAWDRNLGRRVYLQHVGPITAADGLIRYLGLHFLKESQKPPRGWSGHRVFASRGYFTLGQRRQRALAEQSLKLKRELWKAERAGYTGVEAFAIAEARLLRQEGVRWECVELTVDRESGEVVRARPLSGRDTVLRPQRSLVRRGQGTLAEWQEVDEHFGSAENGSQVPARSRHEGATPALPGLANHPSG